MPKENIDPEEWKKVIDKLTNVGIKLSEAFRLVAKTARDAGVSAEELASIIEILGKNTENLSDKKEN